MPEVSHAPGMTQFSVKTWRESDGWHVAAMISLKEYRLRQRECTVATNKLRTLFAWSTGLWACSILIVIVGSVTPGAEGFLRLAAAGFTGAALTYWAASRGWGGAARLLGALFALVFCVPVFPLFLWRLHVRISRTEAGAARGPPPGPAAP